MGIGNDIKPKKSYNFQHHKNDDFLEHEHQTSSNNSSEDKEEIIPIEHHEESSSPSESPTQQEDSTPHYQQENHHFEEPSQPAPKPSYQEMEQLQDDFFKDSGNHNQSNPDHSNPEKNPSLQPVRKKPRTGLYIWLVLIAIALLVAFQNLDSIIGMVNKDSKANGNKQQQQDDVTYQNDQTPTPSPTPDPNATPSPSATPTPSDTPVATPSPSVTPVPSGTTPASNSSIEVLNGNGKNGSADAVKETLVKAGYTVSNVTNARSFTYTDTKIYYKSADKKADAEAIKNLLSGRTCTTEESASAVGKYDIVVVVGKN